MHITITWDICGQVHSHTLERMLRLPEIFADRLADKFQDDPSRVKGTKSSDSRDVGSKNVSRVYS